MFLRFIKAPNFDKVKLYASNIFFVNSAVTTIRSIRTPI